MNHVARKDLIAYVEGSLSADARCRVWEHQRICPRCAQALRAEQSLSLGLQRELNTAAWARADDLRGLLPGIMAETRHPTSHINLIALFGVLVLLLAMLLPALPLMYSSHLMVNVPLLNVPVVTLTPFQEQTFQVGKIEVLRNAFGLEYASPVPLPPIATTAVASIEPDKSH